MLRESGGDTHNPAGAVPSSIQPVRLSALSPLAAFFHRLEKFLFESVAPTLSAPPEKKRGMRDEMKCISCVSVCVCADGTNLKTCVHTFSAGSIVWQRERHVDV